MQSPKTQAGTFPSGSQSRVRCSVFCSASWPRRFFVDDRGNHEHNANHLRLDHPTVQFRFGRTGQHPPETQFTANDRTRDVRVLNLDPRKLEEEITNNRHVVPLVAAISAGNRCCHRVFGLARDASAREGGQVRLFEVIIRRFLWQPDQMRADKLLGAPRS